MAANPGGAGEARASTQWSPRGARQYGCLPKINLTLLKYNDSSNSILQCYSVQKLGKVFPDNNHPCTLHMLSYTLNLGGKHPVEHLPLSLPATQIPWISTCSDSTLHAVVQTDDYLLFLLSVCFLVASHVVLGVSGGHGQQDDHHQLPLQW